MWTLLREVSLRHLRHSPLRSGLVVLGIALGVSMLCAVLSANGVLMRAFEDMADRVAGKADLTVAGSNAGIPSSLTGEIAEVEGVAHAAAMLEVVTHSGDPEQGSILVLGVDFLGDTFFLPFAQESSDEQVVEDPLAFVNDPSAILISKKLAKERGLKEGDKITLFTTNGPEDFYVRGLLEDKGPAASFGGQVVVMFIDAAQVAFSRGYAVDRIDVVVEDGADVATVQKRIEKAIDGKAQVEEPQGRTRRMVGVLWAVKNGLSLSGLIALCVGMFLIYNAVSISVAQRRREIGTLRALGVTKRNAVLLFCLEALVMACFGVVVGLFLAKRLASFTVSGVQGSVDQFLMPVVSAEPELTPRVILYGVLAGFGATVLAAYFPARASNRINPAEALRSSRSSASAAGVPHTKLALLGLLIAAISLALASLGGEIKGYVATALLNISAALFVPLAIKIIHAVLVKPAEAIFGIPGRLALDNVERTLGRSAITVVALMLAVAMSMSVGGYAQSVEDSMMSWADNSFPADAVVTSGSPFIDRRHVAFPPDVLDKLQNIDGLLAIDPVRTIQMAYGSRHIQMLAVDTRVAFDMGKRRGRMRPIEDGPEELARDALYEKPRVLISQNTARFEDLEPGDKVEFKTPTGPREFEVYAVVVDYSSDQGWMSMDRRWFKEYWNDELVDGIDLFIDESANRETVVRAVRERLGNREGLFVTSHESLRKALQEASRRFFAYAKGPEIISTIVAIMGVIGTMLAAIIDRIREIGMLRAIGASRWQVALGLVAESGFLGLGAALCGVLAGVPIGYMLLKVIGAATSGWDLPYSFPVETALRMSAMVIGAAALSGLLPGHKAAGMDIKEALSYE